MRVLAICDTDTHKPISYLRLLWPMLEMVNAGGIQCKFVEAKKLADASKKGKVAQFMGFDLYVIGRIIGPINGRDPYFFKERPEQKIVFEIDDDLTGEHRDLGVHPWLNDMMPYIDAVTVSTKPLQDQMKKMYGKPTYVLPNYLRTDFYSDISASATRDVETLTIGLLGTKTHWADWALVVEPLIRLKEKHGDKISILAGHYHPHYLKAIPDIRFLPGFPYELYPALLRQVDIRLCPLESNEPFNDSKSPIAALEAMSSARPVGSKVGGAIPVCSDHLVYRDAVNNRGNGFLVKDDEWLDVLDMLVSDELTRKKVAVKGHSWVRKHADIKDHAGEWRSVYDQIAGG